MPIYEYRCNDCNRKSSVFFRSISVAESEKAKKELACQRCGSAALLRLFSRFAMVRASGGEGEDIYDFDKMMSGVDENDPKSMARWAKQMSKKMGEDIGPEFNEAMERIESGEDPDAVMDEIDSGSEIGNSFSDME